MAHGFLTRLTGRVLSAVVDPTIVLSFDRTGYRLHQLAHDPDDLDVDMRGKICLITGANSGLGLSTAQALAQRGADVWLLCRNRERGAAAMQEIGRATGSTRLHVEIVDLASLASVRDFAARFSEPRVDVLVNNAGVLPDSRSDTADGIELTFATNVVGPFLLTHLLLPRLRAAPQGRVINVSSGGMYPQKLRLNDIQWQQRPFDGVTAYANSKRAEVILTEMWAERCARTKVTVNCMHPGWADTPAVQTSLPRFHRLMQKRLRTPDEGADTIVWLAVCSKVAGKTGLFWFDRTPRWTHYVPWTRETAEERQRLWELCCKLTSVTPA
jgi:dehydrogenase/reductase SDR family protein 12